MHLLNNLTKGLVRFTILNENIILLHSLTKILFVQETLSKEEFEKLVLEG